MPSVKKRQGRSLLISSFIVGDDSQGTGVFTHVEVPEGCTASIVGEPTIQFRGTNYYASGAKVKLTVANGTAFDHLF